MFKKNVVRIKIRGFKSGFIFEFRVEFILNTWSCWLNFEGHTAIVACKTINRKEKNSTDENFERNQAHMAFIERDVLFIGKDCKFTAALVFADVDEDNYYLVQAAVW